MPGEGVFVAAWGVQAEAAGQGESVPDSNPALAVQSMPEDNLGAAGFCDAVSLVCGGGNRKGGGRAGRRGKKLETNGGERGWVVPADNAEMVQVLWRGSSPLAGSSPEATGPAG